MRYVEIRAHIGVGRAKAEDAFPRRDDRSFRCAEREVIAHVVVALHDDVILLRAAEVIRQEVFVHRLAGVVLAPVHAVDIDMHEAPVRIEAAHVEHAVLDESPRHVEAALHHVLRAGAKVQFVERSLREHAAIKAVEQRHVQAGRAVAGAELETEAALGELRPGVAEARDFAVRLQVFAAVGPENFHRAFLLGVLRLARHADRNGGQRAQGRSQARLVKRVPRDVGVHQRRGNDVVDEDEGLRLRTRGLVAGAHGQGAHGFGGADGERVGVRQCRLGAVERVNNGRTCAVVREREGEGRFVETARVAEVERTKPAEIGRRIVHRAGCRFEERPVAFEVAAVGEVGVLLGISDDGIHDVRRGRSEDDGAAGFVETEAGVEFARRVERRVPA